MTKIPTIMDDKRRIKSVCSVTSPETFGWVVGKYGVSTVTEIVPYEEHGWGSMVTWFAIYLDDEIRWRAPAADMEITYEAGGAE